ncbi:MAG: leucyl aminopeptidase [Proteobacteria bacterium]|nr:leucyl aminopeptidase [Pseudomonadota bacterium]
MKIAFSTPELPKQGCLVVAVGEGPHFGKIVALLARRDINLKKAAATHGFKGKAGETLNLLSQGKFSRITLVGLGDAGKLTLQKMAEAGGQACGALPANRVEEVFAFIDLPEKSEAKRADFEAAFAQGFLLRSYRFDKYFTKTPKDKKPILAQLTVLSGDAKKARKRFEPMLAVAEGVFLARSLVNEPANVVYPETLANACKKLRDLDVDVQILGPAQMKALGMGSILGVARGSENPPRLVSMVYRGAGKSGGAPLAFLGKGVTFDTGGISIKPASGMEDMKYDMAGSAAVIGAMYALAVRKAKVNAVGVIGVVENMPDGKAQRPGDVVTSMSGQTIEVINTDAEGRLVLCDVITYAQHKFKPRAMVDLATLTGAIIIALGNEHAGLFCNNDDFAKQLIQAGLAVEEKLWRFPMNEAYDRQLNSDIADMKNASNDRVAGSIFGAQFLARFVEKKTPWAHLDIAGMAWARRDLPLTPKGATAFGVRLLNQLAEAFEK